MKKNYREDFTIIETFKSLDGEGNAVPAQVPNRVRVEYYVKDLFKAVICERNGDSFMGCRLINEGFGLECAIPLFMHGGIGLGLLKHRVTIILDNDVFPVSEQYVPVQEIVTLENGSYVLLVDGPGDPESDVLPAGAIYFASGDNVYTKDQIDAMLTRFVQSETLDERLSSKVDKLPGKGLSTNDYDDTEKATVAEKYTKPANGIPASDLASGVIPDVSNFITKSVDDLLNYYLKSDTYTKAEVQQLIASVQGLVYEAVAAAFGMVRVTSFIVEATLREPVFVMSSAEK